MPDDPEELLLPLLVLAPLPERDGAADGAPPPLPPPVAWTAGSPHPHPRRCCATAGRMPARPGRGPGELDGDPSMRPRGPALDRLGPDDAARERGALGTLYERERDSDGSLRRLPIASQYASAAPPPGVPCASCRRNASTRGER